MNSHMAINFDGDGLRKELEYDSGSSSSACSICQNTVCKNSSLPHHCGCKAIKRQRDNWDIWITEKGNEFRLTFLKMKSPEFCVDDCGKYYSISNQSLVSSDNYSQVLSLRESTLLCPWFMS